MFFQNFLIFSTFRKGENKKIRKEKKKKATYQGGGIVDEIAAVL